MDKVKLAQREQAVRDAEVKANPNGCARAEPRTELVTEVAEAERITRGLVRVALDSAPMAAAGGGGGERSSSRRGAAALATAALAAGDEAAAGGCSGGGGALPDEMSVRHKYHLMKAIPMLERLSVRRSHIHGWGLYLQCHVERDEPIVEYMGEVVRQCVADKREKHYEVREEEARVLPRTQCDLGRPVTVARSRSPRHRSSVGGSDGGWVHPPDELVGS